MKKKILSLFCLLCFAWSMEGCKALAGTKVCVERNGKKLCIGVDRNGDGVIETHFVVDEDGKVENSADENSSDP